MLYSKRIDPAVRIGQIVLQLVIINFRNAPSHKFLFRKRKYQPVTFNLQIFCHGLPQLIEKLLLFRSTQRIRNHMHQHLVRRLAIR